MVATDMETPIILIPGMNCDASLWELCNTDSYPGVVQTWIPELDSIDSNVDLLAKSLTRPAVLVGLSLGGILAMATARRWPELVCGLILIDTNAAQPTLNQLEGWTEAIKLLRGHPDSEIRPATVEYQESLISMLISPQAAQDPNTRRRAIEVASGISKATLINQLFTQCTRVNELESLGNLSIPVEVLCGSEDALCPVSKHEDIARRIPRAALHIVVGGGHLLALERPEEIDAAVDRIFEAMGKLSKS